MKIESVFRWLCIVLALSIATPTGASAADVICYLDGVDGAPNGPDGQINDGANLSPPMPNCITETLIDGGRVSSDPAYPYYRASRLRDGVVPSVYNPTTGQDTRYYDFTPTPTAPYGQYKNIPLFSGVRVRAMAPGEISRTPIDSGNMCRYIRNYTGYDIFIPFKSELEWASFIANTPPGIILDKCSLPCKGECEAKGLYYGPTTAVMGDVRYDTCGDVHGGINWCASELPYAPSAYDAKGILNNPVPAASQFPNPNGGGEGVVNVHTFSYACTAMQSVPTCCISHSVCTDSGCTTVCDQEGSQCTTVSVPWTETWDLHVVAGDSEDGISPGKTGRDNGWQYGAKALNPISKQIGGTSRPASCDVQLYNNVSACTCDSTPPPSSSSTSDAGGSPGDSSSTPGSVIIPVDSTACDF